MIEERKEKRPYLDLAGAAAWAGGHCWAERRLFELLGGWVPETEHPALKLMLDRHSAHCAWRAEQWWDRLPRLDEVDRDALVVASPPSMGVLLDELSASGSLLARLAGAYRCAFPRLVSSYRRLCDAASPVSASALLRIGSIVGRDLLHDWMEGELALQEYLDADGGWAEAAGVVDRLERVFAAD